MKKFTGIFPALVTPYTKVGEINEHALREIIRLNLAKGVAGFYVNGSTAESFLLSMDERKALIDIVSDEAKGKCTLIYHVGSIATKQAIELAKYGERAGVDAISSIPPFYYNFDFNEIRNYYFDIIEHVDVPLLVYNFPRSSGVHFTLDNFQTLLADERIIGIKHTSMNLYELERLKQKHADKYFLNGHDEVFLSSLAVHADGAIGSTFNLMAEKFLKINELYMDNQMAEASMLQREVNHVIEALVKVGVPQGIKYGLEKIGIECNGCRKPFKSLSSEDKVLLDHAFESSNIISGQGE